MTVLITMTISVVQPPSAQMSKDVVHVLGGTIVQCVLVTRFGLLVRVTVVDFSLPVISAVEGTLELGLVRLIGNCMVGVVGRPSAFPDANPIGLVLAAGTTDESELKADCAEPATV